MPASRLRTWSYETFARLGAAAHARFIERFTEEAVIQAVTALYAELRKGIK